MSDEIMLCSKAIKVVYETAKKIAPTDVTVLVTGENGVGKNRLAAFIHAHSLRKEGPFIAVNCMALPEGLLESELFGHEKGAFTDAKNSKRGCFEQADKGSLFLEEIGDISPAAQGKMLKAIEEKKFYRLGAEKPIGSDVRIIAATNRELGADIKNKRFREDLYFRLNEIHLHLPPLRERREDIPFLLDHYIDIFCKEVRKPKMRISNTALTFLIRYDWPGNIRELRNAVRTAVILNETEELWIENFPFHLCKINKSDDQSFGVEENLSLKSCIEKHIRYVLDFCNGNKAKTARFLGISRPRLDRYITQFRILL